MNKKFLFILVVLTTSLLKQSYAIDRGRVRVVNNVVVAENGSMLRGASANSNEISRWGDPTWWTDLRDHYKLNTVRMFLYACNPVNSTNLNSLDVLGSRIDSAVTLASMANMYLIINLYHHEGYNENIATQVWNYMAPRYKDRTHVIYEAFNEPVHWYPQAFEMSDCENEVYLYQLIRSNAPDTHIILWTPAHLNMVMLEKVESVSGIDYSNASFGYHPYHKSDFDAILEIQKAGYPVINSEFSDGKGEEYIWPTFDFHKENHISWIYLDLSPQHNNTLSGVNSPNQWRCNWPKDLFYEEILSPEKTPKPSDQHVY